MRVLASHLWIVAVLLSVVMISCGREEPEEQKKPEDFDVNEWENTDIDGDATMSPAMVFSLGDTIQVEGKVTMRATYYEVGSVEKCLLDENDIVTIEVSGGTGSTRSAVKKNYVVGNNHTSLSYYEGSPSQDEFHWDYGTEKINIRAWSYGGAVADRTTPITDPDGQVIPVEKNQKENGYRELLYSPLQTDLAYPTAKSGISLPLYHQMARVVVTLGKKATDDAATVSSVTIGDGTASIPVAGKFSKPSSGNTTGTWGSITKTAAVIQMKEETADTYSAVVIPANYPKDMKFIYVTMSDGNKYAYTISNESGIDLAAGKQYDFTISLGDDVATLQAVYPTEWTASGFPITNYTSTEQFGMYAVNSSGELVYANEPMGIARISGTTATLSASASIANKLSTSYTYYIYYPYKSTYNASHVDRTKTNAADFFASMISGWTTDASQGTTDALRKNDLQVGKIAGDGLKTHTLTAAAMTHKAGLARFTLASRSGVPTTIVYLNNVQQSSTGSNTITASNSFSGFTPYNSSGTYLYLIRPATNTTLNSNTGTDQWASALTYNIAAGNTDTKQATSQRHNYPATSSATWNYDYQGKGYSFTPPCSGTYKLECWGAQGGNSTSKWSINYTGGYGGYSVGEVSWTTSTTAFIYVGSQGLYTTNTTFNGGGVAIGSYSGDPCGGGATHIALADGQLRDLSSKKDQIIIVAGGGGGSHGYSGANTNSAYRWSGNGGHGGGYIGQDGQHDNNYYWLGSGGTQTSGGKTTPTGGSDNEDTYTADGYQTIKTKFYGGFGYGAGPGGTDGVVSNGGGGGGYYGGAGSHYAGGGGGSGYIGNSLLSNKHMAGYGVATSSTTSTKTISVSKVSATPTADYAKQGAGYARISITF